MYKIYFYEKRNGKLTQAYIMAGKIEQTKTHVIVYLTDEKTLKIKQSDIICIEEPELHTIRATINGMEISFEMTLYEIWKLQEKLDTITAYHDLDSWLDLEQEEEPTPQQRKHIVDLFLESRDTTDQLSDAYYEVMREEE